ncbi:MAG: hypothetical protein QXT53_04165 [Ignisphaera sp.]
MLEVLLSFAGAIMIVLALLDVKAWRCVLEIFVGSLLIGASIGIYVAVYVGLIVIFMFSGIIVALMYLATFVLPQPSSINWRSNAIKIAVLTIISVACSLAVISGFGLQTQLGGKASVVLKVPIQDFLAVILFFVSINVAIITLMGEGR